MIFIPLHLSLLITNDVKKKKKIPYTSNRFWITLLSIQDMLKKD